MNANDIEVLRRLRRKAHRLGIFLTVCSILLVVVSFPFSTGYDKAAWAEPVAALGVVGTLFGYVLARLYYWFKAA